MYFTYYNIPPNPVQTAFTGSLKRLHVLNKTIGMREFDQESLPQAGRWWFEANEKVVHSTCPDILHDGVTNSHPRRPFSWTIGAAIMYKRYCPPTARCPPQDTLECKTYDP
ncbi:hypothetical protein B0H14DRAFT_3157514 [Mycena olivaceomarginata]|nr:hypothetical protein B0H14DRAFT_3157514 [Mycena olivaceomarginata]